MKTYRYDSEIADLVLSIMGNGTMVVETFNEALLCKYFEMRGTPLKTEKPYRKVADDLETYEPVTELSDGDKMEPTEVQVVPHLDGGEE